MYFFGSPGVGYFISAIGLEEALDEIVRVRQRESFALAEEMVRCCRDHGFSHPLLDDNQAWIAYESCEFEHLSRIWRTLTSSEAPTESQTKLMRQRHSFSALQ